MRAIKTIAITLLFLISTTSGASGAAYIGVILDGFQENCSIESQGDVFSCEQRRRIYKGDKITKLPSTHFLKIKWAPYARGRELNATTMLATFEPPKNKSRILQSIKEMVGLIRTTHSIVTSATRGGVYEPKAIQPGNHATVMLGQKITFALESRVCDKSIIFRDSGGKATFVKNLEGSSSVQLTPEEIGLKLHEIYKWSMSGERKGRQFTIRLLDTEISELVEDDLKEIDKENLGRPEICIKKAAYLQFMSEAYPEEMDLYWLSYQFLKELGNQSPLKGDDKLLIEELTNNHLRHLSQEVVQDVEKAYGDSYARKVNDFFKAIEKPRTYSKDSQGTAYPQRLEVYFDVVKQVMATGMHALVREAQSVADGETLTRDDNYKVAFQSNLPCHIYIAQFDSTGKVDPIFPSPYAAGTNPVQPHTQHSVPDGPYWFYLDQNQGIETIYFLASMNRCPDIEEMFRTFQKTNPTLVQQHGVQMKTFYAPSNGGILGTREGEPREVQFQDGRRGEYASTVFTSSQADLLMTRYFYHE